MASTNKTPQLGLNQWAAGDPVLREDFNGDNAKIDALGAKKTCVTGTYIAGKVFPQIIDLGFQPKFFAVSGYYTASNRGVGFVFPNGGVSAGNSISSMDTAITFIPTGFQINTPGWYAVAGATYQYAAFA